MEEMILVLIIICSIILLILIGLSLFILKIFMLIDCIRREFKQKVKWLVLNSVVPFAYIFYYFIIKRKDIGSKVRPHMEWEIFAVLSFILSFGSFTLFPYLGIVFGVPAIILGIISKNTFKRKKSIVGLELARAGIIIAIISMILQILILFLYIGFIGFVMYSAVQEAELNETLEIPESDGNLIFPAGTLKDTLQVGENKTYMISSGEYYTVEIFEIGGEPLRATFIVNNETFSLMELEMYALPDDSRIIVRTIVKDFDGKGIDLTSFALIPYKSG